jgi:hypothetical protein
VKRADTSDGFALKNPGKRAGPAILETDCVHGRRIGAYMRDTQSRLELAFNAHERFATCSA